MQWNNPEGLKAADKVYTGGSTSVKRYGNWIWDEITYRFEGFSTQEIVDEMARRFGVRQRSATNYVRAFFAYARAAEEDFSGPGSKLTQRVPHGRSGWYLADNPER